MAEMVAVLADVTAFVLTLKLALLCPAGMVMLRTVGLATARLLLVRLTTVPLAPAGHGKATVPVTLFEPTTGFGFSVRDCTVLRFTTNAASIYFPLRLAVITPLCNKGELSGVVMMGKLMLRLSAGTVILAGT